MVAVEFPAPTADSAPASRLCSPMVISDMSIFRTPDLGSTGVELPAASIAPRKPKPSMNMITVTMMKPQMTAAVSLRKSFI